MMKENEVTRSKYYIFITQRSLSNAKMPDLPTAKFGDSENWGDSRALEYFRGCLGSCTI